MVVTLFPASFPSIMAGNGSWMALMTTKIRAQIMAPPTQLSLGWLKVKFMFLRRPQNLKKYSSYFWQSVVFCARNSALVKKVDEDFSKQIWTSCIIQTLTSKFRYYCLNTSGLNNLHHIYVWQLLCFLSNFWISVVVIF